MNIDVAKARQTMSLICKLYNQILQLANLANKIRSHFYCFGV